MAALGRATALRKPSPGFLIVGDKAINIAKITAAFRTTVTTRTNIGWAPAPKLTLILAGMPAGWDRTVTCYSADAERAWKIILSHRVGVCR
jgi:hypothetical protein